MGPTLLSLVTPSEVARSLADRARALRLADRWARDTLANRAGVSSASLKRFERTGKGSLELLLKVAHALGRLDEFGRLLDPPPARSIAELERRAEAPPPRRGRK